MNTNDGLQNLVANMGTARDKASGYAWVVVEKPEQELEAIYRSGWIGRKIVDVPVDDMTRNWRTWSADEAVVEKIEAAERKFCVRERMTEALRWARLFGSSAIMIGVTDRLGLSDTPLDVTKIKAGDVIYLHVAHSQELTIESWDDALTSPTFGQPMMYQYQPSAGQNGAPLVKVHSSRVIPFKGVPLPPFATRVSKRWGDSIYTAVLDTLTTASSITSVIASLIPEAKLDIVTVADLGSLLATAEGEERVKRRFALAMLMKSINNTLLLGEGEAFDQKQINFAGLSDIHIRIMQEVSGAADIPATRLLGQTPAGLQATGESDLRNYYDHIAAKQQRELRPALDRLDAVLLPSEGITLDDAAFFSFVPLWQETPEQKAKNALTKAQATAALVATGLISDDIMVQAVTSQLVEDGVYPGLDAALKDAEAAGDDILGAGNEPAPAAKGRPTLRVVGDAAPRTLYVSRPVLNAKDIIAWAKGQGFATTLEPDDLHVTIAYSRAAVDWMQAGTDSPKLTVEVGGPRLVEPLGDKGAIVLLFSDDYLRWRWQRLIDIGATWDYDEYQPHVTITYDGTGVDLSKIQPYQGEIVFGPERFAEIDESWSA